MDAKQIKQIGRKLKAFLANFDDCFSRSEPRRDLLAYRWRTDNSTMAVVGGVFTLADWAMFWDRQRWSWDGSFWDAQLAGYPQAFLYYAVKHAVLCRSAAVPQRKKLWTVFTWRSNRFDGPQRAGLRGNLWRRLPAECIISEWRPSSITINAAISLPENIIASAPWNAWENWA